MRRLFFLFLFLSHHFYTFAYSFDEILDGIYTVQCRNIPLEFRYQVDLYNKIRRTEEVKSLLFRNTSQNDTLIIIELYRECYYMNYSLKWRNGQKDFASYRLLTKNNKEEFLLSENIEDSMIPLTILHNIKIEDFGKIESIVKEKDKTLHTDNYYLSYTKVIIKKQRFAIEYKWFKI